MTTEQIVISNNNAQAIGPRQIDPKCDTDFALQGLGQEGVNMLNKEGMHINQCRFCVNSIWQLDEHELAIDSRFEGPNDTQRVEAVSYKRITCTCDITRDVAVKLCTDITYAGWNGNENTPARIFSLTIPRGGEEEIDELKYDQSLLYNCYFSAMGGYAQPPQALALLARREGVIYRPGPTCSKFAPQGKDKVNGADNAPSREARVS